VVRIHAPRVASFARANALIAGRGTYARMTRACQLDRLYQRVVDDLEKLMDAVGLKAA